MGDWDCNATREYAQNLAVEADEQVEDGTSGGPIINDSGDLVGIVSIFSVVAQGQHKSGGLKTPPPRLALPVWVCHRIIGGRLEDDRAS